MRTPCRRSRWKASDGSCRIVKSSRCSRCLSLSCGRHSNLPTHSGRSAIDLLSARRARQRRHFEYRASTSRRSPQAAYAFAAAKAAKPPKPPSIKGMRDAADARDAADITLAVDSGSTWHLYPHRDQLRNLRRATTPSRALGGLPSDVARWEIYHSWLSMRTVVR